MKTPVVHIITMLELGGAQQNTLYTVGRLDRSRFEPVLIAGDGGPLAGDARAIEGLPQHYLPELVREVSPVKDLRALVKITALLRKIKRESRSPVIVHTHSSKAGIIGRWAARLAGVPLIVHTVHGFGFNEEQGRLVRAFFVGMEKVTARITDKFIAVAHDNVRKGGLERIFKASDAVVIRSGFDVRHFSEGAGSPSAKRAELGVPGDAPVAVMVSCLKPQKAPVDFVRVAARVLESVPDAHFLQVGDGELRDAVLAEAKRLGVEDRYHLLGWRRDVREIIHLSDVMVLTSLWEGLPKVLPQAMAAGKPIVATAVDGTPEAVEDGVNGFLASPHDVGYMAEKTALLLLHKDRAKKMGEAGRAMVGQFDEKKMLEDLETLYDRLLKEAV